MRALRLLCESDNLNFETALTSYKNEGKRAMTELVENTVMEQLFLALHHLSALEKMADVEKNSDYARLGILAWYYGITNAASAMTAAKDGSFQEDHSGTARMWDTAIASKNLAMGPFGWRVTSLIETILKGEVATYRGQSSGDL